MATRVTEIQVRNKVAELRREGCNVSLGHAYGRGRIENVDGSMQLSPRERTGLLWEWLMEHQYRLREDVPPLPTYFTDDIIGLARALREDSHNKGITGALHDALLDFSCPEMAQMLVGHGWKTPYVLFLILDHRREITEYQETQARRNRRRSRACVS